MDYELYVYYTQMRKQITTNNFQSDCRTYGGIQMRLFEMLLLLLNVVFSAENFLIKKRLPKSTLMLTSIASLATLIIHLLVEGYRFQLIFLYCITVLVFIYSIFKYHKTPVSGKASSIKHILGNTFIIVSILVTASLMYIFPVFTLPNPTGTFKVGTEAFHLVDQQRNETLDKAARGKRELMVQVWYPAENTSAKPMPFIPDTQILGPMAANYGLPRYTFEYLKYVLSHSYKAANISATKNSYPLIIINPGFGSSRFLHTSQAENLASHGYIVVAIDHTYNTFATVFPDEQMTACKTNEFFSSNDDYRTTRNNRDKIGKVLTDDVTFVLNELQLINSGQVQSSLKGRIDLAHIGVFGHSIGGATAYDSSYDPRIIAGIDLDGGLYRLDGRTGPNKPFLFIDSEEQFKNIKMVLDNHVYSDQELKENGATREWKIEETADKKAELNLMRNSANIGGHTIYIGNSAHLNFTDSQFFSPIFKLFGATGNIDPQRSNTIVNSYILDFFDKYLKNENGSLITEPNNKFPEVKFITPLLTNMN